MSQTSQDFVKGIDITGLAAVTGSEMNQLIDAGSVAGDKGIQIQTEDTALDTPDVPNPDLLLGGKIPIWWKRYTWKRVSFVADGPIKHYTWNPQLSTPDPIFLNWQWIEQDAETALANSIIAMTNAANAVASAATALTAATTAQTSANNAQATADSALTLANTNAGDITVINGEIVSIESSITALYDILSGFSIPVPVNKGGTGATTINGAVVNLGMAKTARGLVVLSDVKTAGTDGGFAVAGVYTKRDLNTIVDKSGLGLVTLNGDSTFELKAGRSYIVEAYCFGYSVGAFRCKIRDNTTPFDAVFGQSAYSNPDGSGGPILSYAVLHTDILAVDTTYEVDQYNTGATGSTNLGVPVNFSGEPEIYTQVKIYILNF